MNKIIYIICLGFLIAACSNSPSDDLNLGELDENGNPVQNNELIVNLQFPHKDGLCNIGADITPTQSTVFFEWQASSIAESYTIFVTDLVDGTIIEKQTNVDTIGIVLNRATPYSWYVVSKLGNNTAESETWKFFNAGEGVENYVPFPATINAPSMAATVNAGTINLQWTGSDVDNDIVGYDVYLGTNNDPNIHASNVSANELQVSVTSGTVYYWKVVTKDAVGNTSDSEIFQFITI